MAPKPNALFSLAGRTALVTGAGGGIGAAIAEHLAAAGARVVCAGRTLAKVEARAEAIRGLGGDAHALGVDVAEPDSISAVFAAIAERWQSLAILVNNAGVMAKHDFVETTPPDWDALQDANLRGAFLCTREAVKLIRAQSGGGAIVNISSVAALHPAVWGNAAYSASKAGLLALTRATALEFAADKIRCNAILPGAVTTEGGRALATQAPPRGPFADRGRIPLARYGAPSDVAAAALFLASDAASYVTGQTLIVDGGMMVS